MTDIIKEGPKLVAQAISSGLVTIKVPTNRKLLTPEQRRAKRRKYQREMYRRIRNANIAKGLRFDGKPRVNTTRPEMEQFTSGTPEYTREWRKRYGKKSKGT